MGSCFLSAHFATHAHEGKSDCRATRFETDQSRCRSWRPGPRERRRRVRSPGVGGCVAKGVFPGCRGPVGGKGASSAVNPPADLTVRPTSRLSRTPAANHTAQRLSTIRRLPAVELRQLAVTDKPGGLSIELMLSGPVLPQLSKLDSPGRVVMDLPNTVTVMPQHRIAVGKDGAKAVRVGMDGQVPPTTRVVVDLTRPLTYEMVPGSDNSWILELRPAPGNKSGEQ